MLAGCTTTVAGTAHRDLRAAPVRDLVAVLPSSATISQAVGNRLDASQPPVAGAIDVLPNGIRDSDTASPIECLGPVSPFMRIVYEVGEVRGAAWQEFSHYGGTQTVSSADVGVIEFSSAAEAQRMFGVFVARWKSCDNTTVTTALHNATDTRLYEKITDVRLDGPLLSATVVNSDSQRDAQFPTERAVGLADDCIVDVDVAVTDGSPAQQRASGRALRVATGVLDAVNQGR
ncbi:sensor domain-containing protein [Mycolicibacterium sp. CH28]|uniref:sensor domain-containing protein n=1 Tax=Mycolicibacterium sp. CH28 TaxID=2512237 RepID=UPI001F1B8461|nr:sensor domain-containing protein [Mycolicibacterium sp. CH28]